MSFPIGIGFWAQQGSSDCSSYTPGLYTAEEIDDLVNIDGYIPVASAAEFNLIDSGISETMGVGTCWEGTYTTGGDKKYIQVLDIDMSDLGSWTSAKAVSDNGFIYDGNELLIQNLSGTIGLFTFSAVALRNMRLTNVSISGTTSDIGAIYNFFSCQFFTNNTAQGNVSTTGFISNTTSVGGLGGTLRQNSYPVEIADCFFSGNVVGERNVVGGCFGSIDINATGSTMTNCEHLSGTVTCTQVGSYGIIGHVAAIARGIDVDNCRNTLDLSGAVRTGGILADCQGTITNCVNSGNISSVNGTTAGVVANCSASVFDSSNTGNISGVNQTGGIVAGLLANGLVVQRCFNTGDVSCSGTAPNTDCAGGIIGIGKSTSNSTTVRECYVADCTISGGNRVGGCGGFTWGTDFFDCYVSDTVIVKDAVAFTCGFVGAGGGGGAARTFQNCYSAASIPSGSGINGFTGNGFSGVQTVTNCYWDTDTGPATSSAGTSQTTSQLQTPTSNTGIYSAWTIPPWDFGTSTEYPTLTTTP